MTKVKALSVLQCREYLLEHHGQAGLSKVRDALSPQAREAIYSEALMPADWVDIGFVVDNALAFDRSFGTGDGRASAVMISALAGRHFAGLYRSVLVGVTARVVLEKSSRLWSRYYDQGESQIEFFGETRAVKRVVGCSDLPRYHDWLTTPYYEELLRQCGAKDVSGKHTKCVALNADCCVTELRWK